MAKLNGNKIRRERESKDLNVTGFAEELCLSPRVISRMENDPSYNPGVLTMLRVSEYFNLKIDDLLIKD